MIASVQKAMRLLTIISDGGNQPVPLARLAEAAEINKATCSHIISTLAAEGYVQRVSATKGYILGPATYSLSRYGKYGSNFIAVCRPIIQYLYKKTGWAVILAVIKGGRKYIIYHIDTEQKVLEGNSEIRPDSVYRTATGRVLLANMEESELKDFFEKNGIPPAGEWEGVYSFETLKKKVSLIDKRKIVKTDPIREGSRWFGYAAAVFQSTRCIGALGLAERCVPGEEEEILKQEEEIKKILLRGRNEINRRLLYEDRID